MEPELPGVEQHGVHGIVFQKELVLFVAAVGPVADDGVEDMRHVFAQLMHPAGFGV